MVDTVQINSAVAVFQNIKHDIAQIYDDADEQSILDICLVESNLNTVIIALQEERTVCEAMEASIKQRIEDLKARAWRYGDRADKLKGIIVRAMQETGCEKIVAPEFTISRRKGAVSALVEDDTAIPKQFKHIEEIVKIDKRAVLEALKSGVSVNGAKLVTSPETIAIRSK